MLLERFPAIARIGFAAGVRDFLASPHYLALAAALMTAANLFSAELAVYYCYLVLGLLVVLFSPDLKGIVPLMLGSYMSVSVENNPATNVTSEGSAFYRADFRAHLFFLVTAALLLIAVRRADLFFRGGKRGAPLLSGLAALGVSFVLGGAFSPYYGGRTALFGLAEFSALALPYFVFSSSDWREGDFARLFLWIGLGVCVQIAGMYIKSGVFAAGGDRSFLVTGWGMYNNVGCVMAMCLPAPLSYAAAGKTGYLFLAALFFAALLFTQSRGGILCGALFFFIGLALVFFRCRGKARGRAALHLFAALFLFAAAAGAGFLCSGETLTAVFGGMFSKGLSDNGRREIYREGLLLFSRYPVFGGGFYECTAFRWGDLSAEAFLPPRYHSTPVQLLASGGLVSLACYVFHRVQTVLCFRKTRSKEKAFAALSAGTLLLASLVDCHFFNLGPGLIYSVLLCMISPRGAQKKAPPKLAFRRGFLYDKGENYELLVR